MDTLNASTSTTLRRSGFRTRGARRTPQEIAALKQNSQCRKCNQWGHWHSDHLDDGSIKPGTKSRKSKESTDAGNKTQNGLLFNMATLSGTDSSSNGRVVLFATTEHRTVGLVLQSLNLFNLMSHLTLREPSMSSRTL